MSTENVFDFLAYLRSLTPEDRAIHFQLAEQRYCWHCGGPQGACECGWPAVGSAWLRIEDSVELKACPDCLATALEGEEECATCGAHPADDTTWRAERAAASPASPNRREEP